MIYARPPTWPNVGSPWYFAVVTQLVFVLLVAASLAFFARTTWIFGRAVFAGVPEPRPRI